MWSSIKTVFDSLGYIKTTNNTLETEYYLFSPVFPNQGKIPNPRLGKNPDLLAESVVNAKNWIDFFNLADEFSKYEDLRKETYLKHENVNICFLDLVYSFFYSRDLIYDGNAVNYSGAYISGVVVPTLIFNYEQNT